MGRLAGEWILGDSLKDLEYKVEKSDGTPFNLTGATVTLLGRRVNDTATTLNKAGTLSGTPTDGIGTFSDLTNGLTLDTDRDLYACRVKIVQSGKTGYTDPFELAVLRAP